MPLDPRDAEENGQKSDSRPTSFGGSCSRDFEDANQSATVRRQTQSAGALTRSGAMDRKAEWNPPLLRSGGSLSRTFQ